MIINMKIDKMDKITEKYDIPLWLKKNEKTK